ncbi:hypothetical protein DFH07DRAFT_806800 [Mycena maculata]|uniref:Uncharacterized protein n=1 Tax=Mycena maculata TaxID=230809 RepID=A0AAD7JP72_9AGAR|nr:hypothetical protein DFH07DRAFT_806800 [Mycena maculata]
MLTHASLRRLNLGCGGHGGNTGALLEYLTLPALQTLFIADFDVRLFSDFISRSAPPLEALTMHSPYVGWPAEAMEADFRRLPDLTDFELYCKGHFEGDGLDFLDTLAASRDFLPNLRNITMHRCSPDRAAYESIVTALTVWHKQMQLFNGHDRGPYGGDIPVDADIVAALRPLAAADGMHIRIGTRDANVI